MSNENEIAISRYDEILNSFKNLAINRFKWKDLPIGLTSELFETMLMEGGEAFGFKRDMGTVTILPCTGTNTIDIYGQYTAYTVTGGNGFTQTIEATKGVRIKNNPLATGDLQNLIKYATRLDNIEKTQDVNLFQQNIPKVMLTDEAGKLTAETLIGQLKKFKLVVLGKQSLTKQLFKSDVLDTSSPYLLDKLQQYKNDLINEVLTYLGINNANTDKKERVVVDEVNANNDFISINLDLMYEMRQEACEQLNSMFGTSIKVEKRNVSDIVASVFGKGVDKDGKEHNNN